MENPQDKKGQKTTYTCIFRLTDAYVKALMRPYKIPTQ